MAIYYQTHLSEFGWLLLGASQKGIRAVTIGDNPEELVAALMKQYPVAVPAGDLSGPEGLADCIDRWTQALLDYLSGARRELDLPLDVQGTPFQQMVWKELRRIPYGETRTYTQIAEALGRPQAVRAVARACATNQVALVIPCHRVVRADGSLAGYRWGTSRKEKLLEREKYDL